jgi:hypothetical protein
MNGKLDVILERTIRLEERQVAIQSRLENIERKIHNELRHVRDQSTRTATQLEAHQQGHKMVLAVVGIGVPVVTTLFVLIVNLIVR